MQKPRQRQRPTQTRRQRQRPIPIVDDSVPLDLLTEESEPPPEEDEETESPIEPTEDEDFEEEEDVLELDILFEDLEGWSESPGPKLAIAHCGDELAIIVQGLGQPLGSDLRYPIREKIQLLKLVGTKIIKSMPRSAFQATSGPGAATFGGLVQARLARELERQVGQSVTTWKSRISRALQRESVEMPDGRVIPMRDFFKRTGRAAAPEESELLAVLGRHPAESDTRLSEIHMQARQVPPGSKKIRERYRRRFGRLKDILDDLATKPWDNDVALAVHFLTSRGLDPNETHIDSILRFLAARRSDPEWPGKARKKRS